MPPPVAGDTPGGTVRLQARRGVADGEKELSAPRAGAGGATLSGVPDSSAKRAGSRIGVPPTVRPGSTRQADRARSWGQVSSCAGGLDEPGQQSQRARRLEHVAGGGLREVLGQQFRQLAPRARRGRPRSRTPAAANRSSPNSSAKRATGVSVVD